MTTKDQEQIACNLMDAINEGYGLTIEVIDGDRENLFIGIRQDNSTVGHTLPFYQARRVLQILLEYFEDDAKEQ